jgi:hypothetical protein
MIGLITLKRGALHPRLQSTPNDGEQVEPALAKPENDQVRKARLSDGELARESPIMARHL